jgi:hypothetical protein
MQGPKHLNQRRLNRKGFKRTLGVALLAMGAGLVGVAAPEAGTPRGGGVAWAAAMDRAARMSPTARVAHTLNVKDEGHLRSIGNSRGSELLEEGRVSGTIPGRVMVSFNIGATIMAKFTIYANGGGSISGHGEGALHSTGLYSTFGGSLMVTRGAGRYKHAHGTGGLYGAINRKTYAMTVQAIGKLYY